MIGLYPSLRVCLRGELLADDWPGSPLSLFMWSGDQSAAWTKLFLTADSRLVLSADTDAPGASIVGHTVVHHVGFDVQGGRKPKHAGVAPEKTPVVHDAILRVVTHTFCQGEQLKMLLIVQYLNKSMIKIL